jgi:site-specific DNA recombinase
VFCAIYTRVSTDEQAREGFSMDEQARTMRETCARKSWQSEVYADEGHTGRTEHRPALQRLRADVAAGKVDIVMVRDLSRLARNLRLQETLIDEFVAAGVEVWTSEGPVISKEGGVDPDARAYAQFQGIFNERYSRDLARRITRGLKEKAHQGLFVGPVPYGLDWEYSRDVKGDKVRGTGRLVATSDASTVVIIFTRYATTNYSNLTLAAELNAEGYTFCRRGRLDERVPFTSDTIGGILANRIYIGEVSLHGEWRQGTHDPIVDRDLFARVEAIRLRRYRGGRHPRPERPRAESLLSEILYCGHCGERLHICISGNEGAKHVYYRCVGRRNHATCTAPMVRRDTADPRILDVLRELTIPPHIRSAAMALAQQQLAQPPAPATVNAEAVRKQLDKLKTLFKLNDMSEAEYLRERSALQAQLASVPSPAPRLLDLEKAATLLSDMGALLEEATPEHRRALVHTVVDAVWMTKAGIRAIRPAPAFRVLVSVVVRECGKYDPDWARTSNLQLRRLALYPIELQGHV